MLKCFLIANKRHEYFNLNNLKEEMPQIKFYLLIESEYIESLSREVLPLLEIVIPIREFNYTDCVKAITCLVSEKEESIQIVTADETTLILAAQLREHFHVSGAKEVELRHFQDKRIMKQMLAANGINVPFSIDIQPPLQNKQDLVLYHQSLKKILNGQYIVKPIHGGSSKNTALVHTVADLQIWYDHHYNENYDYQAETYIPGEMYLCDSYVINGEVKFAAASQYLFPCLNFLSGDALGAFPLPEDSAVKSMIMEMNHKVIATLQPPDGALHMEIIIKNKTPVFIEIGARPPGKMVTHYHEKNYAINLYELLLRQALGLPLIFKKHLNLYHAWICLSTRPGVVDSLTLPKLSSHIDIKWLIASGDLIKAYPKSINEGIAAIIGIYNSSYARLVEDIKILKEFKSYIQSTDKTVINDTV